MRFSTAVITVAALATAALASPFEHAALSKRVASNSLAKRSARMTWYDITTGEVACSGYYEPTDYVVAMNKAQFESWDWCGKQLTITYKGKSAKATVVDMCEGCPEGALDLTAGLFTELAGDLGLGVFNTDWSFP